MGGRIFHIACLFPLLLLSSCGSDAGPPSATQPAATQPVSKTAEILSRMQDLNMTKSSLMLKSNYIKDTLAKLQVELNKQGISTGADPSPRTIELKSLMEEIQKTRNEYADADARLKVLKAATDRGEDTWEIDEAVRQHPTTNEADLRPQLRASIQKRLQEQRDIADLKLQSLNQRLQEMKDVGGELDFKLLTFYQTKQDEEGTMDQLHEIDRRLDALETEARSSAK
jgi:hypothetical protein